MKYEIYFMDKLVGIETEKQVKERFNCTKKDIRKYLERGHAKNCYSIKVYEEIDTDIASQWDELTKPLQKYISKHRKKVKIAF